MKIGDPKRASLLGVVAIGAIGFLVLQLLPGSAQSAAANAGPAGDAAAKKDSEALPVALTTDPFSHSALATAGQPRNTTTTQDSPTGATQVLPKQPQPKSEPAASSQSLIMPPVFPGVLPNGLRPEGGSEPAKNAGKDRQSNQETSVPVEVQAVLIVRERKAYISVGGAEAKSFRAGEWVSKGLKLESVNDDGVVLGRQGKSFRVPVGGTHNI